MQRGNSEAFNGSYENHSTDEGLSAGTGEESRSGQPHLWRATIASTLLIC